MFDVEIKGPGLDLIARNLGDGQDEAALTVELPDLILMATLRQGIIQEVRLEYNDGRVQKFDEEQLADFLTKEEIQNLDPENNEKLKKLFDGVKKAEVEMTTRGLRMVLEEMEAAERFERNLESPANVDRVWAELSSYGVKAEPAKREFPKLYRGEDDEETPPAPARR